jgi:general secretion pathway protein C
MQRNVKGMWVVRLVTFVLAALVAWCATYWVLRTTHSAPSVAPVAAGAAASGVETQLVALALGGGRAVTPTAVVEPPLSSRFVLTGVLADPSQGGAAVIAVDGKPAKPFRVGQAVDGKLLLLSVVGRRALLGSQADGPAELTLDLPPLPSVPPVVR